MNTTLSKCPFGFHKLKDTSTENNSVAKVDFYQNKFLVSFSEVGKVYNHNILNIYRKEISDVNEYLLNFVAKENPNLGRTGVVCPYTPGALQKESLFFTVFNKNLSNKEESKNMVLDYMKLFLKIEPTSGRSKVFKSIIIMLPEVSTEYSEEVIERVQNELKPYFVKNGLMIGQFYPNCMSEGIRNPDFRPLQSPIPLLVIRYMVKTDYFFLENYQKEYFEYFKDDYDPMAKDYFSSRNYGASA